MSNDLQLREGVVFVDLDAQDFVYCCRNPYSRKDYTVEYKEEYLYVKLD